MLFFFQAEDGIRDLIVTGVQTCGSSDLVMRVVHALARPGLERPAAGDQLSRRGPQRVERRLLERGRCRVDVRREGLPVDQHVDAAGGLLPGVVYSGAWGLWLRIWGLPDPQP